MSRGRMKFTVSSWVMEISFEKEAGEGPLQLKLAAEAAAKGAARGQKLGQPQARILRRELGAQLSCSLPFGIQWTVPNSVCHLLLSMVGSQHLIHTSRLAHHFAPPPSPSPASTPSPPSLLPFLPFLPPLILLPSSSSSSCCPHTLPFYWPPCPSSATQEQHTLDVLQTSHFVLRVLGPLSSGSL